MKDFLAMHYDIHAYEKIVVDGSEGLMDDNYVYFIISGNQREMIHMEQSALASYLYENDWHYMTIPVPNNQGGWMTAQDNHGYMVLRAEKPSGNIRGDQSDGTRLAMFHALGSTYDYEPQLISSYGQWKDLWIHKLTAFEEQINEKARDHPSAYYRDVMDIIPYVSGISENAIQYMEESEHETRFHDVDQGTIAFRRWYGSFNRHYVWMTELVYDHPARDLAEYIRRQLLQTEDPMHHIRTFLDDYQQVRPLSVFSWRLLYARLLFPVHFFDVIERGLTNTTSEYSDPAIQDLIRRQPIYERRLRTFFDHAGVSRKEWAIPVLHWL
ncbi:spore coat-associated protein CotNH [Lentibacillus halophilus]|uniref:Spore coat-associated protein CotNH n=1 Tax=Lentibacillus halophilus TaxID=295065 RepID=A0ABN0Z1X2_9BACI